MSQVTIYLDEETVRRVERAAKSAKSSVSAWIKARLTEVLDDAWPPTFLETLGSLGGSDLERPAQPESTADVAREPV
jgi:hypothetical protein